MNSVLALLVTLNLVLCQDFNKGDDVLQLVAKAGYEGEAHRVETEDGYILKVHRILPKDSGGVRKFPVFLMHGLIAASSDYVMTGPKQALAYYLADNGYDVWMGNARGNKHSENHKTLSKKSREFWDFSWHEIGYFDVPAMIDLVLNVTGFPKAFYVGHSQGTTSCLVFLSSRPEYNNKIVQAHLLAPAGFMKNIPHPLMPTLVPEVQRGFFRDYKYVNLGSFFSVGSTIFQMLCTPRQRATLAVCEAMIFAIAGQNRYGVELDSRILKDIVQHVSPRISVMQLTHFIQSIVSGRFRRYDHGWKNLHIYNSTTPPDYPVQDIIAPVYLYHAVEDWLISLKDVEHLKNLLPNVQGFKIIKNWNHVDFTYGKNARKVLYKDILRAFESAKNF